MLSSKIVDWTGQCWKEPKLGLILQQEQFYSWKNKQKEKWLGKSKSNGVRAETMN